MSAPMASWFLLGNPRQILITELLQIQMRTIKQAPQTKGKEAATYQANTISTPCLSSG